PGPGSQAGPGRASAPGCARVRPASGGQDGTQLIDGGLHDDVVAPRPPSRHKSRRRQLIVIGLGIAVVAATFVFVLPRIADYGEVWSVVKKLSWQQIAALVGATALNLVTFASPWLVAL